MPNLQRIKTFFHELATAEFHLDREVNTWIEQTGCEVHDIRPVFDPAHGTICLVVLYQLPSVTKSESKTDEVIEFTGTVVSREVERVEDGKIVGHDYCMAGAFPVPEYTALSSEDSEVAPMVLLSPDFKLEPYSDWFRFPKDYEAIARLRARPEEAVNA